jgi:hypothetical protein
MRSNKEISIDVVHQKASMEKRGGELMVNSRVEKD